MSTEGFKQAFLPRSLFGYKLRWKLKRSYKVSTSPSQSYTDESFKDISELSPNVMLHRDDEEAMHIPSDIE